MAFVGTPWETGVKISLQIGTAPVTPCDLLVMRGVPREPGYRVVDWRWEARRVKCSVKGQERGRVRSMRPSGQRSANLDFSL